MRIALIHAPDDSAVAAEMSAGLTRSGVQLVASMECPDGLVVLISEAAVDDGEWLAAVEEASAQRVAPVRLGSLPEARVPSQLRQLNWIDWAPERPSTTLGFVLAGLFSNPDMYRLSQQLDDEAEAWKQAGRPKEMLVGSRGRARQMKELLEDLAADPMAAPSATAVAFIEASDAVTKKAGRRRLFWRGGAGLALLVAVSAAISVIPSLQAFTRINHAAIVTAGDQSIIDEMPEWSAANAALLVREGSPTQRELGKTTLIQAMTRPWTLGTISFIDSIRSLVPLDDGAKSLVVALTPKTSALAEVDVRRGRMIGYLLLPRRFEKIDVSADERYAAVAGDGAGIIPFRSLRFRLLAPSGSFVGVRASGPNLLLWTEAGRLETRAISSGTAHLVGDFDAVLDVAPDGSGGGAALVASAPGRYEIIDIATGSILASARIPPAEGVGALAPDGRRAVLDAADAQFWTFGVAQAPQPTGISVPIVVQDLAWASDNRLVIGSESKLGEVYYLPRGQLLGSLCSGAPSVTDVQLEQGGETVACGGDSRSIWRLPPAPRSVPPVAAAPLHETLRSAFAQVRIRGAWIQVSLRGSFGSASAEPIEPFDSAVTAAAFSKTDRQFAIGSARGSVMVVGVTRHGTRSVVMWSTPDAAPISRLRWDRGFIAETASGQAWRLPDCSNCQSAAGLLAEAKSRFSGCFSDLQLSWIDEENRAALGLIECEPIAKLGAN